MLGLGPHAGFIVAAYGVTLVVIAALVLWILLDHRALITRLHRLEARGARRRSGARADDGSGAP